MCLATRVVSAVTVGAYCDGATAFVSKVKIGAEEETKEIPMMLEAVAVDAVP